jgi:insertion element IS1 protein InsB
MSQIIIKLNCPHCFSAKVVKNGKKRNNSQNYLCKACKKQFLQEYFYWGSDVKIKRQILTLLVYGNGIRDISAILGVSKGCVLRTLVRNGSKTMIKPSKKRYNRVQIDELYSFVHTKKKKVWVLYAYDTETDEILAVSAGKRSKKTVKDLLKRLNDIEIDWFCTDNWDAFKAVLPENHLIGKQFTKAIEGVNTALRNSCKRLNRRTTSFSKKVLNHWCAIKLVINYRNTKASYF